MNRNSTLGALAFILSGFTMQTVAQSEVSGQVKDFDTREALTFCNVSAFNQGDTI